MGIIHQSNFTQLTDLDPILRDIWESNYARELGVGGVLQLFNILDSNKAKETDLRIGSFSDPVEFTGKVQYTSAQPDYEIEYAHSEFANGFTITRSLLDDLQYDVIFARPEALATSWARKIRKDAASIFNNAFSSSNLGYDSKALCATDHPRSKTDSTAVSNKGTSALTSDALEAAIVAMQDFGDDRGEEIVVMPDTLVVPRALRRTALQVTGSEFVPENANNAVNGVNGGETMNVVVDPYLTDTNNWFVIDSTMARRYLKWYNRVQPEFAAEGDFDTLVRKYRGYGRWSYGWSDFRWVYGNEVA